ncbi:MAG: PEP-CTERM sorting domain-containing protein [Desulfobacula sp.]|nr:PEP-CTERM sorting domain-containing protein [Desulfobacula sp.]
MKCKKHIILAASLFLMFVFVYSSAQADTITYESLFGTTLNDNSDNISYTYNTTTYSADLGEFQLTAIPDIINTFGYCVDIETPIFKGYTYEYRLLDLNGNENQTAWLLDKWSQSIDEKDEAVALQLAIWETLYSDLFNYDTTTTSAGVDSYYATYISSLSTYNLSDIQNKGFMIADLYIVNPDTQQVVDIQNIIVQVVPEPATMLLFGLGLLGIGAVGRRKS